MDQFHSYADPAPPEDQIFTIGISHEVFRFPPGTAWAEIECLIEEQQRRGWDRRR